jgi:poly-gamma-glutamate synthesis protein (capsule biosynthesis protein)
MSFILISISCFVLLGGAVDAPAEVPQPKERVCLAFAGDLMHHCVQGSGADSYPGGATAGYANYFAYVKPFFEAADLAIGNLETPLDRAPRDCFPRFRAPPEYAFGIKEGGFDLVSFANNHAMDYGKPGIDATLKWVAEAGLLVAGTTYQWPFVQVDVGGVKVAVVAYTMLSNGGCKGEPCPLLSTKRSAIDERLAEAVVAARKAADVVVVYLHWQAEYQVKSRKADREMARVLLGLGAHAVVGSHSHVLGTATFGRVAAGKSADDTAGAMELAELGLFEATASHRRAYVRYSLGNFVSGMKQFPVRMGGMETICFTRHDAGGYEVDNVNFVPTYVRRDTFKVRSRTYQVLPLREAAAQCRTGEGRFPKFSGAECREILEYDTYLDSIPDLWPRMAPGAVSRAADAGSRGVGVGTVP